MAKRKFLFQSMYYKTITEGFSCPFCIFAILSGNNSIKPGGFIMKHVKVCGAIVFTKENDGVLYVIVKSKEGVYGFPKGHAKPNESEQQTAIREIKEETNLDVKIINGFRVTCEYKVPDEKDTIKDLVLFLAEYKNQSITFQKEELQDAKLMNFNKAMNSFKYENLKNFLKKADDFIKKQNY